MRGLSNDPPEPCDTADGVDCETRPLHENDPFTRYSRRVEMAEIEKNDFNLNISRYISTAIGQEEIDLKATHDELRKIEASIQTAGRQHNKFLRELDLPELP